MLFLGAGCAGHAGKGGREAGEDAVHHGREGEGEQLLAGGEVVPHRADRQAGLISHFTQGRTFQPVGGDDPADGVNDVQAPYGGIHYFGHPCF